MNKLVSIFAMAAVLALLAGCKVGPDYHPPETKAPGQWTALSNVVTNQTDEMTNWWTSFHDDELDSLIARAVRSNFDLTVATVRVREARASRSVVESGLWPVANGSGNYQRIRESQNGYPPFPPGVPLDTDLYQAGFDAAWELDVFGGQRRAVESANAGIGAAEESRRDVVVTLLGEVARNYVEARGFQRRLAIALDNIHAQQDTLNLTSNLFVSGLTSDLDVQQSSALLASTEAEVPTLETGFQQSAFALSVLTGQPPGALLDELTAVAPIPSVPPEVPVGLPSELLLRRPDVRRAERDLAAATANIGVAKSDLFPKFSLTGDIGLQSVSASDWFTSGSRFWSAGPAVQWRIFDFGQVRGNIRVQNARQEEALATYEQTVLNSMQDVEAALTAYAKEQIRRKSLNESVQASQQALEISEQLYKNGLTDFLRVLDSQRSLYASEDALAQSDQTVAINLVTLYKALGGGWQEIGEGVTPNRQELQTVKR